MIFDEPGTPWKGYPSRTDGQECLGEIRLSNQLVAVPGEEYYRPAGSGPVTHFFRANPAYFNLASYQSLIFRGKAESESTTIRLTGLPAGTVIKVIRLPD